MTEENSLNKNIVPFKREDWLRQPNSIARMGFRMELIQLRAFTVFLERLEPMFLEMIDMYNKGEGNKKKLSIYDTQAVKAYINSDYMVEFKIRYEDLGIKPGYYSRAKASIEKMPNIVISVPVFAKNGKLVKLTGAPFYHKTAIEGLQRCGYFTLSMPKSYLDSMIDMRMGYNDQLKRIVFLSSNIYTTRLYWMVKGRRYKGVDRLEIPLYDFRCFMNLIDQDSKGKETIRYKRFCDLDCRVIRPAVNELKSLAESGNSDLWVDVDRKDIGENQNPTSFIITIHESKIAQITIQENLKKEDDTELLDLLRKGLNQPATNVRKLMAKVTPEVRTRFIDEVNRTIQLISSNKEIKKPVSYAWAILNSWLEINTTDVEDVEVVEGTEEKAKSAAEPIQQNLFASEDPRWEKVVSIFKESLSQNVYNTWFCFIRFISERDKTIYLAVPTGYVHTYLYNEFYDFIQDTIATAFGEGYKLDFSYDSH